MCLYTENFFFPIKYILAILRFLTHSLTELTCSSERKKILCFENTNM